MSRTNRWPTMKLGDICDIIYGKALKKSDRVAGPIPVYGSNGVVDYHSEALFEGPTIVVGRKGSAGAVEWSDSSCWIIDTAFSVRPRSDDVDLRWLYWALKYLDLGKLQKHAAVPGISKSDVLREDILLPPLAEQQHIAEILDDSLQNSKQIATKITLLDEEEKSAYLSLFGSEPATTPTQELAADHKGSMRTGPFGSQLKHEEFVDEGIAVLGLDNVVSNRFRWAEPRHITAEKYEQLKRYTVYPGDVLISIMGTTGRCVIIPDDVPTTINTKHICAITTDRNCMLPEFLRASFLWHPEVRQTLRQQTKGAIMAGLNMGIIKKLPLPVPDLSRQQEWVRVTTTLDSVREGLVKQQSLAEELHSSLATRAFAGQL